jgi:hypothetical protein
MQATMPQQLKIVAERTLSMVRELGTPTNDGGQPECDLRSVALELGELRAVCEGLVEELAAGTVSDRQASITLLGIHARVDVLLELFYGSHGSLEESTKKGLLNYMAQNEFSLQKEGVRAPGTEEVAGDAETSLPNLLKTLAKKTIILLAEVSKFYLSKEVTLSVSPELNELRDRCGQLIEEVTAGDIPTMWRPALCWASMPASASFSSSASVLLMTRLVLIVWTLGSSICDGLATSLTDREQSVKHYVEKAKYVRADHRDTDRDAAEKVE